MKNRIILFSLLLAIAVVQMSPVVVMSSAANPAEPACKTMPAQQGELRLTIPAGSTSAAAEQPVLRCAGSVVQATGGTLNRTPVIINAALHHDQLILSAFLLAPQPGPTDVTVYWRLD